MKRAAEVGLGGGNGLEVVVVLEVRDQGGGPKKGSCTRALVSLGPQLVPIIFFLCVNLYCTSRMSGSIQHRHDNNENLTNMETNRVPQYRSR